MTYHPLRVHAQGEVTVYMPGSRLRLASLVKSGYGDGHHARKGM